MFCKLKTYSLRPSDAVIHTDFLEVWMKIEESIKIFESEEETIQQTKVNITKNNKQI